MDSLNELDKLLDELKQRISSHPKQILKYKKSRRSTSMKSLSSVKNTMASSSQDMSENKKADTRESIDDNEECIRVERGVSIDTSGEKEIQRDMPVIVDGKDTPVIVDEKDTPVIVDEKDTCACDIRSIQQIDEDNLQVDQPNSTVDQPTRLIHNGQHDDVCSTMQSQSIRLPVIKKTLLNKQSRISFLDKVFEARSKARTLPQRRRRLPAQIKRKRPRIQINSTVTEHLSRNSQLRSSLVNHTKDLVKEGSMLEEIVRILSQGDLKMDLRLVSALNEILEKLEKSRDPFTCKVAVDIAICKKYVKDFVEMKKIITDFSKFGI